MRVHLQSGERQTIVAGDAYTVAGMSPASTGDAGGGIAVTPSYVAWLQSTWREPSAVRLVSLAVLDAAAGVATTATSSPPTRAPHTIKTVITRGRAATSIATDAILNITTADPGWADVSARFVKPIPVSFPSADGAFTLYGQVRYGLRARGKGVRKVGGVCECVKFRLLEEGLGRYVCGVCDGRGLPE